MKRSLTRSLALLLVSTLFQAPVTARQQEGPAPAAQTPPPAATPTPATQTTPTTAATPNPPPGPARRAEEPDDEDDVVRITSNLIQFDAVVTDKKGRQVTDLRAEEFEILADGKPQAITNFAYVSNLGAGGGAEAAAVPAPPADRSAPPLPPTRLRPEQVRRTVAFVFNDLQMSWESVYYARKAIKKFVDEQMQPGDFVAIIPASGGSGALQQFTSDKRLLYAAVKNLRWFPQWGGGITPFGPAAGGLEESEGERLYNVQRTVRFSVGTLNALETVVGALRELPGRKSLVLLSDGIPTPPPDEDQGRVLAGINRVIESANRASVIIYAVDARGLQTLSLFDASSPGIHSPAALAALSAARGAQLHDSQRGLKALAEETGGVAYVNSNDIGGGVRRALEDQAGYYLIGYRPEEGTFDPQTGRMRYHRLTLKVRRQGLKVRTRRGFFAFEGKSVGPSAPRTRTRLEQMRAALVSPFPEGGVRLRLTSLFGADRKHGPFVRSLLHIDGTDISFQAQPDGTYKAVLDVVALTFGVGGRPVGEANTTHTVSVKEEDYRRILRAGLVFNMAVPTKQPGGYQLRAAVRDTATERVGSASQFVEVPDLKKGRIALSGIIMESSAAPAPQGQAAPAPAPGAGDPQGTPGVRRFRRGSWVSYAFNIFNAKADRADGRARLLTQVRLFRDGKPVFEGRVLPFDAHPQNLEGDIGAGGRLLLGGELPAGEYVLQMIVTDLLAKEKQRVTAQWIDFELVE